MKDLFKYIDSPHLLDEKTIGKIHELTEKYPYFQTAHLLKVKNLHNIVPEATQPELQLAAAYVTERKTIYYLLHPIAKSEEIEEEQPADYEKDIKESLQENIADTIASQLEFIEDTSTDILLPKASFSLDMKKEYGAAEGDEYVFRIDEPTEDSLELIEEEHKTEDKPQREPLFDPAKRVKRPEVKTVDIKKEKPQTIDEEEQAVDEKVYEPKSFTDWIEKFSGEDKPVAETPVEQKVQEAESVTTQEVSAKQIEKVEPEKQEKLVDILSLIQKGASPEEVEAANLGTPSSVKEDENTSLIDKFINAQPKIIPKKAEDKLEDVSQGSVEENDHFITDTLAQIYVKQGHYAKAIFAYEKLSLKYPEKSTYFAAQIAEIKKLINNI